jgi:hypothetical protein
MKMLTVRLLLALSLCGAMVAPTLRAQDQQGAGTVDTAKKGKSHWHWFHRNKPNKPAKADKYDKHARHEKQEALYNTPKSLSRWHGGGPAPTGAGTK